MFRSLYLLLLLSFPLMADGWFADFDQRTRSKVADKYIPGYSMVFVQKNHAPQFLNYGLTESQGSKVSEHTLFRLASVSKTFTGCLTAKLVEQGKLDWQTSISDLAPQFGFNHNGHADIKLVHLLSQSSGFTPNAYDNLIEANYTVPRILNQLSDLQPICEPGRCYTYQNALFAVLDQHFEQQDQSYSQLLQEQLLTPLGMDHTSVGKIPLESAANWAKPHVLQRNARWRQTRLRPSYYRVAPAAGINTNTHDLGIWLKALLGEEPDVISPHVVAEVTKPRVDTKRELRRRNWRRHLKSAHYGLGWRVYDFKGHKLNYHSGWVQGYRAEIAFAPDYEVGFAILMNAESNLINEIGADFWASYFASTEAQEHTDTAYPAGMQ